MLGLRRKPAFLESHRAVDWALAQVLGDEELEARLYRAAVPRASRQLEPDYAWIPAPFDRASEIDHVGEFACHL